MNSKDIGTAAPTAVASLKQPINQQNLYQLYLALVSLVGVGLFLLGLVSFPAYADKQLFLLLCGLAAVSALVTSSVAVEQSGITYSVGPAVALAAIPHWGPLAAILISTGFNCCLWLAKPKGRAWKKSGVQLAFNNGMHAIAFLIGGWALLTMRDFFGEMSVLGLTAPWLVGAIIYEEVNIWLLIGVLRLQHGPEIRPLAMWREEQWASRISVLVLALGGGILAFASARYDMPGIVIFYLPIVLSAYAFRLYVGQMQEHMDNLEQIVSERTKDLAQLNRQKDAYLAVLTHDMMTPLTTIQLCAEEIKANPTSTVEDPKLTTVLLQSQQTLLTIVRNILDIEKLQSGEPLSTKMAPCDLAQQLRGVVSTVQADADARNILLTAKVMTEPLFLYADRRQIERLLLNLLSNAVKYTPAGGNVDVTVEQAGQEVLLAVRDTGYGIPAEELPYIFERFRRVELLQDRAAGAGLGLTITKAVVDEHSGQINVESEVGKGTLFTVRLPIEQPAKPVAEQQNGWQENPRN